MQRENQPRKRALVGRGAPQILVRCPQDVFDNLHRLATTGHKSLNLTAIEVFKIGLTVYQNAKSPAVVDG